MDTEAFDRELEEQVSRLSTASLLAIPGIYEILSEELNNSVLSALEESDDDVDLEESAVR